MSDKAKRGTKRACGGCGGKFYDLKKEPPVCPMCETVFEVKKTEARPKKKPVKEEKPKEEKPEAKEEVAEGEDDLIDIDDDGDDEENNQSSEDDDTFLVVEDESESTVSAILPAEGASKDEEG